LSYDVSPSEAPEVSAVEPDVPAADRPEFSAPEYLTYDLSRPGSAEPSAAEPPADDRPGLSSHAAWEGSLFDEGGTGEAGDERYVPAVSPAPSAPPKPGTPSSGNLRLPDWMREEGGYGSRHEAAESGEDEEEKGGSRIALIAGAGVLVLALVVAACVYVLRSGHDSPAATPPADGKAATGGQPQGGLQLPAQKAFRRFPGTPTAVIGQFTDTHAGLSYPRFGAPWQVPSKRNKLGQLGWSGQQVVVTERNGAQLWYGQLLSGTLGPGEMNMYPGPGMEQAAAVAYAKNIEDRFYGFPHRSRPFASQPLNVSGHKGWLVSSYLQYRRPGIQATGELVVTAVINTGRPSPAVLFMAIPNTHRRLWPDLNYFLTHLRVAG
jgi:hypothetical protein